MTANKQMTRPSIGVAIGTTAVVFILLIPAMMSSAMTFLNMAGMYALAWYGWAHLPESNNLGESVADAPPIDRLVTDQNPFEAVDRNISRASRLADSDETITALHRFRRLLLSMIHHEFSDELAIELDTIVERNFPDLIRRYVAAKQRAHGNENDEADRILTSSLIRLTTRMSDIDRQQSRAQTEQLRQHDDYLRQRHPVEDDPFGSIGDYRS